MNTKYFPLGGIAISPENEIEKGSLCCFLPLPIESPVPYHINGYFFLVNESGQGLFRISNLEDERLKWNESIFNEIINNLMVEALAYRKENIQLCEKIKFEEEYLKYLGLFYSVIYPIFDL